MRRAQKTILVLFAATSLAMLCFPPWRMVILGGWRGPKDSSPEGHAFLLTPPALPPTAYHNQGTVYVGIDWPLLGIVSGINVFLFGCLYLIFQVREGGQSLPVDQILAKKKRLISVLIALCFPPVYPIAYIVPDLFIEGGHLLIVALVFAAIVFALLFGFSYLALTFIQRRVRSGHGPQLLGLNG